jgi:hypothetical protein
MINEELALRVILSAMVVKRMVGVESKKQIGNAKISRL